MEHPLLARGAKVTAAFRAAALHHPPRPSPGRTDQTRALPPGVRARHREPVPTTLLGAHLLRLRVGALCAGVLAAASPLSAGTVAGGPPVLRALQHFWAPAPPAPELSALVAFFSRPPRVTPVITQPRQNDSVFNRGHCLTTSRGPMTWSCGDAMYFLNTPGYTTLDRNRGMTLVYTSNTAAPKPLIAANVTLSSAPDRVRAVLAVGGVVKTNVVYTAWSGTKQIVLSWDAGSTATGAYPYTLTVYAVTGTDSTSPGVATGLTTVVNRSASPYGNGWEWLGVERLILRQPAGTGTGILWVDGDGSTALYHQVNSTAWAAPADEYKDTIVLASSQYTRTGRHGIKVVFDATGRHISTVNRAGQVTNFTWVSATQLDSVLLPPTGSGKAFKVQYTSARMTGVRLDGRNITDTVDVSGGPPELTRWIWPDGTSMRFGYEAHHQIVYSVYSDADWMWTTYDSLGMIHYTDVYWDDPHGNDSTSITSFTPWQELGYAWGTSAQSAADTAGAYTTIDGPQVSTGRLAVFQIDKWGAPTYERDAYGTVTRYVRGSTNAPGLVSEIDFPNARKAYMLYDARGNLTRMADSTYGANAFPKQVTSWVYGDPSDLDSPTQITAPDGTASYYSYNSMGLTDSMTDARGHLTTFAYQSSGSLQGQLASVTEHAVPTWVQSTGVDSIMNLTDTLIYGSVGNLAQVNDRAGGTTRYAQDGSGRTIAVTNPVGFVKHYVYDVMDRLTKSISLNAKGPVGTGCITSQFTCDSTLILDALNPFDTDTSVSRADSAVTAYTYDLSRLIRVVDPRGVVHQYTYDQRGMLQLNIDDQFHADTSFFDNAEQLTKFVSRDGFATTTSYDLLGRQTQWIMPARSTTLIGVGYTAAGDTITSAYDAVGNLLTHHDHAGTITRTYFENGALMSEQSAAVVGFGDTLSYAYDGVGRLQKLQWPRGDTIRYGYNGVTGDLDSISPRWHSGTTTHVAPTVLLNTDVMGRSRGRDFQVYNSRDTLHYDALGVLRSLRIINNSPSMSNRFEALLVQDQVDVLGRSLHQKVRCDGMVGDPATPGAPCGSWMPYETNTRYNRVGAVVIQSGSQFASSAATSDTFRYDRSGNRRQNAHNDVLAHTATFTYPSSNNRVTSSSDSSWLTHGKAVSTYTYDVSGSRTKDTLANKYVQAYQYDAAERLRGTARIEPSSVTAAGGGSIFVNDTVHNGNTCDYNADGLSIRGCGVGIANYVGANVVRERVGDWWYVSGPGLDEPVMAVKRMPSGGSVVTQAWLPVFSDGRGQLIAIADSAGNLDGNVTTPEYDAGIWNSSGLTAHAQSFNPRRQATPGGIDTVSNFRNRQYDPATGRWLQEDPSGMAGGVNLYEYNGNDPNSFSDPFGLCPVEKDGIPCAARYAPGVTVSNAKLATALNSIAAEQNKTLIVNSGDRSAATNARVGGEANSPHLAGEAADVRFAGTTATQTEKLLYGSQARKDAHVRLVYHQPGAKLPEHSHLDLRPGPDRTEQKLGSKPRYVNLGPPEER